MKKSLALLLALVMLSSLTAAAFAEEAPIFDTEPGGYRITVPDAVKYSVGIVEFYPCTVYSYGVDIFITGFNYLAMTEAEYAAWENALYDPKATDEEVRRLSDQYRDADAEIFTVTASATRELADFYEQTLLDRGLHPERIPLGEADGFVFDLYDSREDCKAKIDAWKSPFAEDFPRVHDALKDALIKAELFAPDTSDPFKDLKLSFETRDLDGNPVSSEDLFKQNTITMLNFWATWCGPCKAELKDLGELARRLPEQNCALVGMLYDSADKGAIDQCKALLAENDAEYLNLMFPEDYEKQLGKQLSFPTTLMVDSSGTVLASIVGAAPEAYEPVIQKLLDETAAPAA